MNVPEYLRTLQIAATAAKEAIAVHQQNRRAFLEAIDGAGILPPATRLGRIQLAAMAAEEAAAIERLLPAVAYTLN